MINNFFAKIKSRGFTLVETLIAISVLAVTITGPLAIAQKGLQAALIAKDQITAFYLAQDAIEYIRYARDTNCLVAGGGSSGCPAAQWLAGNGSASQDVNLTPCVSSGGTAACTIDVIALTQPAACAGGVCSAINYDSTNNYFTYASGAASIFTRTIKIISPVCGTSGSPCNANEAAIAVTVTWKDPISHSITVNENIDDWQ
ncbi:MAG TPA: prepilin-type N-terminal cleavage/methylation domain-containing protein [Candidatus Paceibacterota bacterium]|jgi:prepilin-type N-terminal cleavage/methylation domain-containing protein|nr:prepilin-type N-terminal cleavage/methylation domain-containing protein [Candidatus Paceibacterota bacterium]